MNYVLTNNHDAQIEVRKAGAKVRIFANETMASELEYPYTNDGQLFDENGKLFRNVDEFAAAFSIQLSSLNEVEADEVEADDNDDEVEDVEVEFEGTFSSIAQLKAKVKAVKRHTQNDELTIKVSLKVTVGKVRVDGRKQLLEDDLTVTSATIDSIRSKWLFLTFNDAPLYVKEFELASFAIDQ